MLNSKYSKVLTIILIIAIIAIVALLAFIGIDWYRAYTTGADNDDFSAQFNEFISNNITDNNQTNNTQTNNTNDVIDPIIDPNLNDTVQNNTGNSGGTSSSGLTYKGFNVVARIEIPKTNVNCPVLEKVTPKSLEASVGVMYGPGVNKVGNTVIAGHNYRNGTFFSNNKKLNNGDKIYLTDTSGHKVTYEIYHKYTTDSNDFEYASRDTQGRREISLTTCTDDSNYRIIIWAKEV